MKELKKSTLYLFYFTILRQRVNAQFLALALDLDGIQILHHAWNRLGSGLTDEDIFFVLS